MSRSPAAAIVVSLVTSLVIPLLAPSVACAQTPPPQPYGVAPQQPPPGYVPLVLQGAAPGMSYELTPDVKNATPIAGCPSDCLIYVPPGKYRLNVGETLETRSGRRTIDVYLPTRAYVEPRTKSDKDAGLIMGISGSVMFIGGIVGLAVSLTVNTHCNDSGSFDGNRCKTEWTTGSTISLLAMVAGGVLAPIGWVQFGRSAPTVTSTPLAPATVAPPRVAFDVVPLRKIDASGSASLAGGLLVGMVDF
ncbi:MAG: hypothetical protein ABI175_26315 [Polyangiales bacterium]